MGKPRLQIKPGAQAPFPDLRAFVEEWQCDWKTLQLRY